MYISCTLLYRAGYECALELLPGNISFDAYFQKSARLLQMLLLLLLLRLFPVI